MSNSFLYFAYGSDMSLPQMRGRMLEAELVLADDARRCARLPGFRLAFNRAVPLHDVVGHANLQAAPEAVVEGVLYELPQAALAVLDQCEGVAEKLSRRIEVEVQSDAGVQKAFAYVAQPEWEKEGLQPSRNHLYRLLSAYRYLSPEYFAILKATESLKVPVDDEGMPHGTKRKVRLLTEAKAAEPQAKPAASLKAPAPKTTKTIKAVDSTSEEKVEKKKFYPPVGAYAPKSAHAFRKAFGIPEKKDKGNETEAPRSDRPRPSPWAGRGESRNENRSEPKSYNRDSGRGAPRGEGRGDRPQAGNPWTGRSSESRGSETRGAERGGFSRGESRGAPRGGKKPGKGRPW